MYKKILFITLAAMALCLSVLFTSGCKKDSGSGTSKIESVKFGSSDTIVVEGGTVKLTVNITPSDAEHGAISITSKNETVATVTNSGNEVVITGVKAGKTDIVATVDNLTATCHITVTARGPQKYIVKLNTQKDMVEIGKTIELTATVNPAEGANAVWTSGDETLAKVTGDALKGTVTGVAAGKTFIYCIVNEIFKDSCEVKVISGTANCYIVTAAGTYSLMTVKGNSTESVGEVKSAEVLWETFGTDKAPNKGDIISSVTYENGMVTYTVTDKKGNAVIAVKDASGNILWSWHIWCTDQPAEQVYNNDAGTMMDRNLGATSATKGDAGALGLLYQWGRKDPFLGADSIAYVVSGNIKLAASTLTWPSAESASNCLEGGTNTLSHSIKNPTTFIINDSDSFDWYCTNLDYQNDSLWIMSDKKKTIYDPCPVGYRVPDGSSTGIWQTAFGKSSPSCTWDDTKKGYDFGDGTDKLVSSGTCWYPAAGYRKFDDDSLSHVGSGGFYWSCTPGILNTCYMSFSSCTGVIPSNSSLTRADGQSVRCVKE